MFNLIDRACAWWLDKRARAAARGAIAKAGIERMTAEITAESYRINVEAPNLVILLDEAAALLDRHHAENYLEITMIPRAARTNWRAVRVTLQWLHGLSPAEKNAKLEAERDNWQQQAADYQASLNTLALAAEELLKLKDERPADYEERKPKAWAALRAALESEAPHA